MTHHKVLALLIPGAMGLQLVALPVASADKKKGLEIAKKVDKAWVGYKGETMELELELISATGQRVVRKMEGKAREEGTDSEQMKMTITWPADQKGTHLLTWSYRKKYDDQWLYLPSIQRVKRISSKSRSGSFMGSELAYEDLSNTAWVEKFDHDYLRDQKVGARDTWVLDRVPRDKESGYSKQTVWIDKEYLHPIRVEFYDRKGKLLKVGSFKSFKKYGGKWRADRFEVANRQTGKKSNVVWKKRSMGQTYSGEEFLPEELEN